MVPIDELKIIRIFKMAKKTNQSADACLKKGFLPTKHVKQSRMGASLRGQIMKQTDPSTRIIICAFCGNPYTKKTEFIWHISTIHCFEQKKLCKTNRKKHNINLKNVKSEIKTIKDECDEELLQNRVHSKSTDNLRYRTGDKPFKCDVCSKLFSLKTNLNVHMRCHTGEKPFKCEFCSKSFSQKDTLNIHLRCHTGEKPFKCDICLKSFTRKNCLKTHVHCHTEEKPFKCEICSKSYTRKYSLGNHMLSHTGEKPFKCEVCSKGFKQKWEYKYHAQIHTGERPFKCEICMKGFYKKSILTKHLRIHDNEDKSIPCEICFKVFKQIAYYKRHMLRHIGEKPTDFNTHFLNHTHENTMIS